MARNTNQLTLSFLDTTSLSAGGLTLDAGYSKPHTPSSPPESADDESLSSAPQRPRFPPGTSILPAIAVLRAAGKPAPPTISPACAWRSKSKRKNATPPQTNRRSSAASPASAPANSPTLSSAAPAKRFPPAGRTSATNWSNLFRATISQASARSTQYAHYTPEFVIRAIWRAVQHMGFSGGPDSRARLRIGTLLRPYARSPRR